MQVLLKGFRSHMVYIPYQLVGYGCNKVLQLTQWRFMKKVLKVFVIIVPYSLISECLDNENEKQKEEKTLIE